MAVGVELILNSIAAFVRSYAEVSEIISHAGNPIRRIHRPTQLRNQHGSSAYASQRRSLLRKSQIQARALAWGPSRHEETPTIQHYVFERHETVSWDEFSLGGVIFVAFNAI